ncbi:AMP-binding protein [Flavobacterium columnare]|uniref:Coenzyme F390 synthetase n=2 Tax=Flavobacterium columnare TaxID=996 RepID=G8X833_FLACA|nr:AMP-binding protein [Flavobacterium columnare]AEW87147.1 coenzyme F390 synthetase [Flavobacterium columnare ATCC 49512]AMO20991.1 phenylacetate--CoA ligase family protein [Flavobacterium columnare]ANO47536.1 coenzyme F390 synthetase [Flavobacterium columnare]APT21829.1 phenylacetate--CoA ligase [Flavobacterium columnare]AUX18993.1 phenylacetate--CoA ligase [Flavobacterium columnare]
MIPEIETLSSLAIKEFQEQKLKELLVYLNTHSTYYKNMFDHYQVDIKQIQTLEDLQKLPLTSKNDLQQHNDDFLCVPRHKIIDYSTTSGTLGNPVTFGLTDSDLDRLAYNEALSFACAGIQEGDVVQLMTTMDRRFMAGLAYFMGLRKLKAGIIRVGAGIPELQWDSILKYHPKYLIGVPSFLLKMIEYAEKQGIDYQKSSVKGVICIGESLRNQDFSPSLLTQKITKKWNVPLYSTYASTEMSTAFTECKEFQGGHHHPELIITEVLDECNNPVTEGSGELVITTLGIEGMPLLRFQTGDIVQLHTQPCACGRNTQRVGPVIGRKQHMIKYKGTTLYPPAMHDLMTCFESIKSHLIEISTNDLGTDEIIIKIASTDTTERFLTEIKDHFRAKLRVSPKVEVLAMEELQKIIFPPMSRKPITLIDKRN